MSFEQAIFRDDSDTLVVSRMPGVKGEILVGLSSYGDTHEGVLLAPMEVQELHAALKEHRYTRIAQTFRPVLYMREANRGDPYRAGIEICLGDRSIFLEEGYAVERLVEILAPR